MKAFHFTGRYHAHQVPSEPKNIPDYALAKFRALRDNYLNLMNLKESDTISIMIGEEWDGLNFPIDLEDWTENVIWLIEAVKTGAPVYCLHAKTGNDPMSRRIFSHIYRPSNLFSKEPQDLDLIDIRRFNDAPEHWDFDKPLIFCGQYAQEYRHTHPESFPYYPEHSPYLNVIKRPGDLSNLYHADFFKTYGQRETIIACHYNREALEHLEKIGKKQPTPDVIDATLNMIARHKHLYIKNLTLHKASRPIILEQKENGQAWTYDEIFNIFIEYDNLSFAEGHSNYAIQEYVTITHETRVLCVDSKVVSMAGNIEKFCPIYNESQFDDKLEVTRNKGVIERRPDLISLFHDYVMNILPTLHKNAGAQQRFYNIDVALINGKPGVIEMNNAEYLGLFALDIGPAVRALAL